MEFLITGGAGYIGQLVCSQLEKEGHKIKIVDLNLFDQKMSQPISELEVGKINQNSELFNTDAIIHLAAIVGEPACLVNPEQAFEYNYKTTKKLAELCKKKGLRVVYASTCSVYGNQEGMLTEESKTGPVDFYGQTRLLGEREILKDPKNIALRFGTVYGWAPRIRFDLVINKFIARATNHLPLDVFGGKQNRPFTHVEDIARAVVFFASMPEFKGIYNVAHENYNLNEAAKRIAKVFNGEVKVTDNLEDNRNYTVSNKKLLSTGFVFKREFEEAVKELSEKIISNHIDFNSDMYYNDRYPKARQIF